MATTGDRIAERDSTTANRGAFLKMILGDAPPSDKRYAVKIAAFNALVCVGVFCGDTYVDGHVSARGPYATREYWLGAWVLLFPCLVFCVNYRILARMAGRWYKCVVPFGTTVLLAAMLSLLNFRPPFPNWWQIAVVAMHSLPGVAAAIIAYHPSREGRLGDPSIPLAARIEWIKERAALWRTIAISGAFGCVGGAIPWVTHMSYIAARQSQKPADQDLILNLFQFQGWVVMLYVLAAPVYECFLRAKRSTEGFLHLRETVREEVTQRRELV